MSQEPSINSNFEQLLDPSYLTLPVIGYKALDLTFDKESAGLFSPSQREFQWWSWEEGATHRPDEYSICTETARIDFPDGQRIGILAKTGHSEEAPREDCTCGYWIFHHIAEARNTYGDYGGWRQRQGRLTVRLYLLVWGYGPLLHNDLSFRSRYMWFAGIPRPEGEAAIWCERLAWDFGIECMTYDELEEYRQYAGICALDLRKEGEDDRAQTRKGETG